MDDATARAVKLTGEKAFEAFEARFGVDAATEVMDRIANADWKRGGHGVTISDVYAHNACNHTISGIVEHARERFGFVIDSGDRAGTVIREWGPEGDIEVYEPEPPTVYTFVPRDADLASKSPALFKVYLEWRKQSWFKEAVRGYNYDRHFAPGVKTERHYRDLADNRGLRIVDEEEAGRIIKAAGRAHPAARP